MQKQKETGDDAPPNDDPETFAAKLLAAAKRVDPEVTGIAGVSRVSAGATLQTWSIDLEKGGAILPLILRRSPGGRAKASLTLDDEAAVIRAVGAKGLAAPAVWHVLRSEDALGEGFLMERIDGETLPRRIIRMVEAAGSGETLTRQLGKTLGQLHRVSLDGLPGLSHSDAETQIARLEEELRKDGVQPRPVFELALKWLRQRIPDPVEPRLVHGDFRIGNVIVGKEGLRAVLDWEIVHIGDPAEDLAWMQVPPWRFGGLDKPVGGIGRPEVLYAAYEEETGEPVDVERVRFFRVLGSLRWGVSTAGMVEWLRGHDPTVERAMIARRASENEIDLLRAMAGKE
ncbi:phosphotransferase family protein [Novosphingobium sp. ZN18A2]|uniref:phosphotransferase family protein n=1 Tax=Novosphingobium sp. ZN18A2 TaxID=3079861 RepID=UPI0030CB5D06